MSAAAVLRGIAWNHSRALPPLVATAQRFEELHPGVSIQWEKRSLHEFGHAGLSSLAASYDLLIVDHPMMGSAHEGRHLLDLGRLLDPSFLSSLAADSVGLSYNSYVYEGSLFALPIDAAAPAASCRPDLLERAGVEAPRAWRDVFDLARKKLVLMPGWHVDLFLNFVALYLSRGGAEANGGVAFDRETGEECLDEMRELAALMPPMIYDCNPIRLYELMAAGDDFAYCPFAYSYSNYSRAGFGEHRVLFANPAPFADGRPLRTVLGGTGIAVSSRCAAVETAIDYISLTTGEEWQRTLYALSGGQPARRSAWRDQTLNQVTNSFFERTLESVETAYVRPRYSGYIQFQEEAGPPIIDYLRNGGRPRNVIDKVNALYLQSRKIRPG